MSGRTIRFTTASGAEYTLVPLEGADDGEYVLTRDCIIPVKDFNTGADLPEFVGLRIEFVDPPTVGERFSYYVKSGEAQGWALSTAVQSIEDTEKNQEVQADG